MGVFSGKGAIGKKKLFALRRIGRNLASGLTGVRDRKRPGPKKKGTTTGILISDLIEDIKTVIRPAKRRKSINKKK